MKTCGIICEYNPFHKGHEYQIRKIREMGYERIVAIMSGNLVQRGEIAITDKWSRAKSALYGGADLVCEIPSPFSMSYAENFAKAGVFIATNLGCDALCFGSESGSVEKLTEIGENLKSPLIDDKIKAGLKSGLSFTSARAKGYEELFGECPELNNPNDILGIEYISAINKSGSKIKPITVKREGAEHDSNITSGNIASASHIRSLIESNKLDEATRYIPKETAFILKECAYKGKIAKSSNIENSILSKLRTLSAGDISSVAGVGDGLDFRIYNAARKATTYQELVELIKTKRYTMARIKRALLSCYFEIKPEFENSLPEYIRILGMTVRGEEIIKSAKSNVPIVIRASELKENKMFNEECRITDLYVLSFEKPYPCGNELTTPIIKINNQ